jgi:hypothetical protein
METTQYFQPLHLQLAVVVVEKTPLETLAAQVAVELITVELVALHLLLVKVMQVEHKQAQLIAAQVVVVLVQQDQQMFRAVLVELVAMVYLQTLLAVR